MFTPFVETEGYMSILTVASETSRGYRLSGRRLEHDFNAQIFGSHLLVSTSVAAVLKRLSVRTADEFVSFTYTYPSIMANELGWSLEDFKAARQKLVGQLRGHVAADILAPAPLSSYSYGAVGSRSYQSIQARRKHRRPSASASKRKSPKPRHKASSTTGSNMLNSPAQGKKAR